MTSRKRSDFTIFMSYLNIGKIWLFACSSFIYCQKSLQISYQIEDLLPRMCEIRPLKYLTANFQNSTKCSFFENSVLKEKINLTGIQRKSMISKDGAYKNDKCNKKKKSPV